MIARISFTPSYVETLGYCLHDKRISREECERRPDEDRRRTQNRAEVLYYHRCCGDHRELARQFREVQKLNYNIRKPVLHLALSLPPGEKVSKSQLAQMAKDCAKALDFEHHQYVVILHKDTEHRHAHIVVNRIGFDQHTVVNQYMIRKVNQYCRATELQYGLTPTKAMRWYRTPDERMQSSEHQRVVRLKEQIRQVVKVAYDLDSFKEKMRGRGYQVYKTDRGISFKDSDRVLITGFKAEYPWKKIEKELAFNLAWQQAQRLRLEQEQTLRQQQVPRIPLY
jgi:hypothetical protein